MVVREALRERLPRLRPTDILTTARGDAALKARVDRLAALLSTRAVAAAGRPAPTVAGAAATGSGAVGVTAGAERLLRRVQAIRRAASMLRAGMVDLLRLHLTGVQTGVDRPATRAGLGGAGA